MRVVVSGLVPFVFAGQEYGRTWISGDRVAVGRNWGRLWRTLVEQRVRARLRVARALPIVQPICEADRAVPSEEHDGDFAASGDCPVLGTVGIAWGIVNSAKRIQHHAGVPQPERV